MRNPLRNPFSRPTRARPFEPSPASEVDDELAFHLEERVQDLVARGVDPVVARKQALARFGDIRGVRSECEELLEADRRAERRRDLWADVAQDVRFGVRAALRAPLFSLLAIITIALGVGANAAVFGVVKSVLLDALPYADADRLVRVYAQAKSGTNDRLSLTAGQVVDIAERVRSFERAAVFFPLTQQFAFSTSDTPYPMQAGLAGANFFDVLGVRPVLGRSFTADDMKAGAPPVVVLGHSVWRERLAGDSGAIGRTVRLDGKAVTVIGVLPPGFVGPMGPVDAWVPLDISASLRDAVRARKSSWLGVVARLGPGVTMESAGREVAALGTALEREHPDDADPLVTLTAKGLRDDLAGDVRTQLIVLTASAALVLLITCANLAGALLSRTLGRRQELAVRVALGAARGRLVRQLLTESVLLSALGGILGVLLAAGGLALLRRLSLDIVPAYADLSLDPLVVAGAFLLALATGIAFGVAPAVTAARVDPQSALREEARGGTGTLRVSRLRGTLAAGQIALCVSLVASALLLGRSLWLLTNEPLGFDPDGVFTASFEVRAAEYPTTNARTAFTRLLDERIRAIPGVTDVAFSSALPSALSSRNGFTIDGQQLRSPADMPFVLYASVSGSYFSTLRVGLKEGRLFTSGDRAGAPTVMVISEAMANRYWPSGNAVGARIRMGPDPKSPLIEIVGVVADIRNDLTAAAAEPMAYGSSLQDTGVDRLLVRTTGDPVALAGPVQRELAALNPGMPLYQASTLRTSIDRGFAGRRVPLLLIAGFGGLALLLAAVGVYAMVANMVAARSREFGIRLALGAGRRSIMLLVLRQGGTWIGAGLVAGAIGVTLAVRLIRGMLYGVSPLDPLSIAGAAALLVVAAAIALFGPVRRAVQVDPITVIR
ncbi:MAG: ABC transporter permease [Gemmatimonadota bacterium]